MFLVFNNNFNNTFREIRRSVKFSIKTLNVLIFFTKNYETGAKFNLKSKQEIPNV